MQDVQTSLGMLKDFTTCDDLEKTYYTDNESDCDSHTNYHLLEDTVNHTHTHT